MARLKKLYLNGKRLDLPHPFEEELERLVSINHSLVMENISRMEVDASVTADHLDLPEIEFQSDELRKAANNLALVGLVTRLHHWLSIFVEELTKKGARENSLVKNLEMMNKRFGEGPIPIGYFKDLVAVRDSVVHADAKIEWELSGKKRRVADQYANTTLGEVEFTTTHLQEASEKSTKQVKWYDAQLDVINPPESDPGDWSD